MSNSHSNTTNIFLYGVPGSGKTCFLAAIFRHIQINYSEVSFGLNHNPKGADYAIKLVDIISNGQLPPLTMVERDSPVDISIRKKNREFHLRFIDLAGELMTFWDEEKKRTILTDENGEKIVKQKIDSYIKNKTDKTIMVLFFDPENAISLENQDQNYYGLKEYLDHMDLRRISSQHIVVVTKFDSIAKERTETKEDVLRRILRNKLERVNAFVSKSDNPRSMSFSIGEIDKEKQAIKKLNISDSKDFVDFLFEIVEQKHLIPLKVVIIPLLFLSSVILYFYDILSREVFVAELIVGVGAHFGIGFLMKYK